MSDIDEGVMRTPYVKQKSDERAHSYREGIDTTNLPNWFPTKSIIKKADVRIGSPAVRASPRFDYSVPPTKSTATGYVININVQTYCTKHANV